ncbi:RuBisCO large subunit C-terminal-like domain-containing protein [Verrucosispora sp. WMMD1129]|uniref:RuBisCO large subunit C-terminal-like domain-containing protein n=1 Tax=Verrucosispora sp. WMMD1129 TaxID=3016093 RepID=UPI00249CD2FD|nr:RuBisCO large subunit C-terminal-like domain-containing protein [Verrucosispora sp. WMMD1129]WFE43513.1 RuBisCO large subunit C-terminal-like domain-containing protein [Verrucosispora sp. WMMD1129]
MNWRDQILDPDSLDLDAFVRATYSFAVPAGADVRQAAVQMLRILTQRSQRLGLRYSSHDPQFTGAVIHVGPVSTWTDVTLALPLVHAAPSEGLSHLFQLLTSAAEYSYADGVWLQRVDLPRPFLTALPGPQLGIDGIRSMLGVQRRPLLALETGCRIETLDQSVLDQYRKVLVAGADLLVDDMLLGDPPSPTLALQYRLPHLVAVCRRAAEESGRQKAYVTCLAGTPSQIMRKAEWAAANGAKGFVVNGFSQGLGTLEDLSSHRFGACLIATNMGSGMVSRPSTGGVHRVGVDEQVISKLSRLAGADAVHTGTTGAECFDINWSDAVRALAQPLQLPGKRIPGAFRVAEGDLQMINIWPNIRELGHDTIFEIHSAILGDPDVRSRTRRFLELMEGLADATDNASALTVYRALAGRDVKLRAELDKVDLEHW